MKRISGFIVAFGPVIGLVLVYGFFAAVCAADDNASFASVLNLKTIVNQTVIVGIGALGMTYVIISGGIDLSVGSQIALCSVVVATVMNKLAGADSMAIGFGASVLAAFLGVAVCALCGLINGALSSLWRIAPFIVTLGMMQIARGAAKWISNQQMVFPPDENALAGLMNVEPSPSWLIVSPGVWAMILLTVATFVVLRRTVFGRHVFAIGSNEETAKICGIATRWRKTMIYALCGVYTGIAGLMQFANLNGGSPTEGVGMELDVIAAVVIGGASLNGGEGRALGSIVGALIMAVLRNGCNMVGVQDFVQNLIVGVIIIAAVGVDRLKHKVFAASQ